MHFFSHATYELYFDACIQKTRAGEIPENTLICEKEGYPTWFCFHNQKITNDSLGINLLFVSYTSMSGPHCWLQTNAKLQENRIRVFGLDVNRIFLSESDPFYFIFLYKTCYYRVYIF